MRSAGVSAFDLLRRPEMDYAAVTLHTGRFDAAGLDDRIGEQLELELTVRARYEGYIERQRLEIEGSAGMRRQRCRPDWTMPGYPAFRTKPASASTRCDR